MSKRKKRIIILLVFAIITTSFFYIDYSGLVLCNSKGVYSASLAGDYNASVINTNASNRNYVFDAYEVLSFTSPRFKNYTIEFHPPQSNPVMGQHTDWKISLFAGCALQDRIIKKRFEQILTDFNVEKNWLKDAQFQKQRKSLIQF